MDTKIYHVISDTYGTPDSDSDLESLLASLIELGCNPKYDEILDRVRDGDTGEILAERVNVN